MDKFSELILLAADGRLDGEVSEALSDSGSAPIWSCQNVDELSAQLQRDPAKIVLVDADPDPMGSLSELEPLVRRFDEARFVIICSEISNQVLLEAMQIGARHCLLREALAADLPTVIGRLSRRSMRPTQEGRLISVLSTRGGCGATTTAINLAEELRLQDASEVLLVDLDFDYGATASYLGVEPRYGIGNVLREGEKIDDQLIRSTAATFRDQFNVLASPASIPAEASKSFDLDYLESMLGACKRAYPITIVDAPRLPADLTLQLARESAVVLVIFELAVIDLRRARHIINELQAQGVSRETIVPVASRYKRRGPMLRVEDAEAALTGFRVQTIRNDFESVIRSVNLGETLATSAPRSPARKDICALLEQLQTRLAPAA